MPNIGNTNSRFGHQLPANTNTKKAAGSSDNPDKNIPNDFNPVLPSDNIQVAFLGGNGENVSYKPENLQAYFLPHTVSVGGTNNTTDVHTGVNNDIVYLNSLPGGGVANPNARMDDNTWTVDTSAGRDVVAVGGGNNNFATVDLGNDDDTAYVMMAQLTTSMSGNIYNLDGGQGEDDLRLGKLPPNFDFSKIKSKLQPDGSYQLIIPPSNGGPDNIINVSNFESVTYQDSPFNLTLLSFSDFIAKTTPI